jgi:hypothetical protein
MTKRKYTILLICFLLSACYSAGTLGGWDSVVFPKNEKTLDSALKILYTENQRYEVPEKWKFEADSWHRGGYDFLKSNIFYFVESPEEMYYVSYIDPGTGTQNPEFARISIRAVYQNGDRWIENEDCDDAEKARIQKRFEKEIITKLEKYTKTKSYIEE